MFAIQLLRRDHFALDVLGLNIILLYVVAFVVFIEAFLVSSILVPFFESVLGLIHITAILQCSTCGITGAMISFFT
jgi:hypothetical protein